MKIGERLKRAIARSGLTQKEVADRAGMDRSALSDILTGVAPRPSFDSVERILRALGLTFSELFDEPRLRLSEEDAELGRQFHRLLGRILQNDAAQKEVSQPASRISSPRATAGPKVLSNSARKRELLKYAEVERLANEPIPARYQLGGARYAYKVLSDTMIGVGILEGATIYVRHTQHDAAADDHVVICKLNGVSLLRRLDRTGDRISLHSENPRYDAILVDKKLDKFTLVGVVVS
ncbi:MAG TPA: helix-turn-helix domain-containing protein [Thermoanaerobaculia bacterium]|jgi:SOS-response transcriptional repressor LexA